ncbi:MAG: DUF4491 family protein [Anaerolineales bacterium]|nr:DUF4491 family protein [Anaerolineales bacterium]
MEEFGILLGLLTLITIGLGFPIVILIERWFGWLWWPYLLGLGTLIVLTSLWVKNVWLSAWFGVLGATLAWGSTELKKQARRAELGWFPNHPQKIDPPFKEIIRRWKAPSI